MEKIRVLLADDHTIVRQGLRVLLEAEPDITVVAEAETGRQAVQMAKEHSPDVIVMDIAMPGLNGITATHRLRLNPRTRRIPIIVLTGYAFRAIEQGALEAGANVFLTKPCLPEDLELKIRELLSARGA
jgi:CheY-like chemotaxis protein